MALRSVFLGSVAALLLACDTAGAQTSVMSGATGGVEAGTADARTNSGSSPARRSIPFSDSAQQQEDLRTDESVLESSSSLVNRLGVDTGPIATTSSPTNAPAVLSDTGSDALSGTTVPTLSGTTVPALSGTTVPALSGTTVPAMSGSAELGADEGGISGTLIANGELSRSNTRLLTGREAARLRQLQAHRSRTGAQIIVLSGTVFRGTTDRHNMILISPSVTARGELRGLSPQTGGILVVQGSQLGQGTRGGQQGQIRAQIVIIPAQ